MVFFPAKRANFSPSCARRHHCRQRHILSFDFRIGFGLDVFASLIGEQSLKNCVFCASSKTPSARGAQDESPSGLFLEVSFCCVLVFSEPYLSCIVTQCIECLLECF